MTELLKKITDFYLNSRNFNGIPISQAKGQTNDIIFQKELYQLIEQELIVFVDEETDINPHILRHRFKKKEFLLQQIEEGINFFACLYPTSNHLKKALKDSHYSNRPYTRLLAEGRKQLSFISFDLTILEYYRNDPRFRYSNNDIGGYIYYNSDELINKVDKIFLETFGFSYNSNGDRAVAIFLRYLNKLTPEQQQLWKSKELDDSYRLHPDYFNTSVLGKSREKAPVFEAFIAELQMINKITEIAFKKTLFKKDFRIFEENPPHKFSFLIRPTLDEYNEFVLLLDKLISDNINYDFFDGMVEREEEIVRKDKRIEVRRKGSFK